ncbi:MAG TPA: LysM peptidoglycan-binding domain-containing protein [Nitrospirae bacterium]|nr:LysM peptidoglycan-binding domain-containing protein [Nitrospirota bacterium]
MRATFVFLIISLSLLLPSHARADETEYVEYTVKKGDTLWDITGGKLSDPFQWPNVWKENPKIKNPDLIYPGQRLRLPKYMLQKQIEVGLPRVKAPEEPAVEPAKRPEAGAVRIPPRKPFVVEADMIAASGYIDADIPRVGKVVATPDGRSVIGNDDTAYIELYDGAAEKGKKFYTVRSLGEVRHPSTGMPIGYLIEVTGVIEVTGQEAGFTKAKVLKAFVEIQTGDPIDNYYPIESFPLVKRRSPSVSGTVVAARDLRLISGNFDVVYIDRGSADGVVPGSTFTLVSGEKPNRPIGSIQVISTRPKTAAAIVTKSETSISRGDYF